MSQQPPTPSAPRESDAPIDVIRQPIPTSRVEITLSLALIEELEQRRGPVPRSTYLALIIDAAMTREEPHLPAVIDGADIVDALADRRCRQHVRSIELSRAAGSSSCTATLTVGGSTPRMIAAAARRREGAIEPRHASSAQHKEPHDAPRHHPHL